MKLAGGTLKLKNNQVNLKLESYQIRFIFRLAKRKCSIHVDARYNNTLFENRDPKTGPSGVLFDHCPISNFTISKGSDLWSLNFRKNRYVLTDLWLKDERLYSFTSNRSAWVDAQAR